MTVSVWIACRAVIGLLTVASLILFPAPISSFALIVTLLITTHVKTGRIRGSFIGNGIMAIAVATIALFISKILQESAIDESSLPRLLWPLIETCFAWSGSALQTAYDWPSPLCRFLMHPAQNESGLGFLLQGMLAFTLFWSWFPFGTDYSQGIELISARSRGLWPLFALSLFLSVAVAVIDRIAALYPGWQRMTEERPLLIVFVPLLIWPAVSFQAGLSEYARKLNAT
jgi:hypothetical protein